MKKVDLYYDFPEELIAAEPSRPTRVMWTQWGEFDWLPPQEMDLKGLLQKIPKGDVLVINNTKVIPARVFADDVEILFMKEISPNEWEVLFPSKKFGLGDTINLPKGAGISPVVTLIEKGRPQKVKVSEKLSSEYFKEVGDLPLPPYIQKARESLGQTRRNLESDLNWYQPMWGKNEGSLASPTASLHFSNEDLELIKSKGVKVKELTLHVGLGTFLPITCDDLSEHKMHSEFVHIPADTWEDVQNAVFSARQVWALGTTVARALESVSINKIPKLENGDYCGSTDLMIQPGYQWNIVGGLITNFHQPGSTLLALVSSFSDLQTVKDAYKWAIEKKFKLFSYGDLTVWKR